MKVKMITRLAGPEQNAAPGQVIEVSNEVGKALLAAKSAVPVAPPIETTSAPPPPETRTEAPKPEPEPAASEPEPEPDEDAAPELPANHDPTVGELGIETKVAELLMGKELYLLSEVEAFGDLTAINGIGDATAATIATAIADWKTVHRPQSWSEQQER